MKQKNISAFVELAFYEEDRQKLVKKLGMEGTFSAYLCLALF